MMSRPSRLRAVLVGAGLMGRWHGWAARRVGALVVAVVDPQEARAQVLARNLGARETFSSLEGALEALRADVVHVCTPLSTHGVLARTALAAGCHVLVEKPFTATVDEAREVLADARRAARLVCPTHQFLFQPGVLRLQARSPDLGPLRHLQLTACSAGADGEDALRRDRVAAEILPHFLSLTARLTPLAVDEVDWHVSRSGAGEIRVLGAGGRVSAGALVSMTGRPTRNELDWIGEGGSAHLDLFHGFATFEDGAPSRLQKAVRPFGLGLRTLAGAGANLVARAGRREPAYPGLMELARRFYAAVPHGGSSPIPESEILSVSLAWERLWKGLAMR